MPSCNLGRTTCGTAQAQAVQDGPWERIDTTEGWIGKAADQFRDMFDGQASKWLDAGDSFHAAVRL